MSRAAKQKAPKLAAEHLLARIRERYTPPEWAYFPELRGGTAWTRESRVDALVMNLYPSRGMELHGFEVKCSRSDWKRELDNPGKSEPIQQFTDRWWVVASSEELIFPGELPPTWGLMVPHGDGLRIRIEAPKLKAKPLDRAFVAAILRRAASEDVLQRHVDAALDQYRKRWEADAKREQKGQASADASELARLRQAVQEFEQRSGVRIDEWNAGRVGDAVRFLLEHRDSGDVIASRLQHLAREARSVAEAADKAVAEWPKDAPVARTEPA